MYLFNVSNSVLKLVLMTLVLNLFASHSAMAGSLYDANRFQALYEDKKAYRVGDGITILIYENAQATSSAGEGSSGDFALAGTASVDERNWGAGINLGAGNDGEASTNRNGFLKAQITAVVTHIDENHNLFIEGTQTVSINEEAQVIKIKGKVRKEDVSAANTVPSFRIQNAEISIDGDGSVTEGKNSNLLARFINWLGF
ncbi:flagellar basal body L-ring protein FlgH [Paraneptunicella aestuarii]|uniref:flagellar basal body L-ring protein FlgH n=1 Tax=Paraneptunicella aestuarii TaxID=2831148 RepID=UPI001E549876|nr:flagellar basal body L-ring protein FlgH [Paraneptunicella aestuarii]UAA37597.1 flagellar basal body L-ring protein FlgH [Paraneptunicella aestuarii]